MSACARSRLKLFSRATRSPDESYIQNHCYYIKICRMESLILVQSLFSWAKLLFILLNWTPLLSSPIIQHLPSLSLSCQKMPGLGQRQMQRVCNLIQHEYWLNWAFPLLSGQLQLFEFPLQALSNRQGVSRVHRCL